MGGKLGFTKGEFSPGGQWVQQSGLNGMRGLQWQAGEGGLKAPSPLYQGCPAPTCDPPHILLVSNHSEQMGVTFGQDCFQRQFQI